MPVFDSLFVLALVVPVLAVVAGLILLAAGVSSAREAGVRPTPPARTSSHVA